MKHFIALLAALFAATAVGQSAYPHNAAPPTQHVTVVSGTSDSPTEATLAAIKAKTDNLDVALSTRTKAADTQTVSGTLAQGTAAATAAAWPMYLTDLTSLLGTSSHPIRVDVTGATTEPVSSTQLPAALDGSGLFKVHEQGTATVTGTVTANAGTGTFAVSAASLPLPSGAATAAKQPALGVAGTASADVITVQGKSGMTAVVVDGSGVTQPVSGSVTANIGTSGSLALDATLTGGSQKTKLVDTGGTNVATVSSGGALKVDGSAATQPVSGTVAATQSGTWTVQPGNTANTTAWKVDGSAVTQPVSGTVTANAGSNLNTSALALDATLTGGTQKAIARGGAKGSTAAADVTSTSTDANHNALDVNVNNTSLAVTGTFFQATQPVSGTVAATQSGTWTVQPGNTANTTAWKVDGSAVTQPVSGTITANAGTNLNTSSLALDATLTGGTQQTKITDGTNVATVKAASTAAGAADKAVVVAVSPNNTVGVTGTFFQGTQPVSISGNQAVNVAQVAGTNAVNGGLAGSQSIGGTAATNAAINQNPVLIAIEANSAQPSAASTGNQRQLLGSLDGALYTRLGGPILWSCGIAAQAATLAQCQATPGAGLSLYITSIIIGGNTATAGQWTITSGTGTNCGTTNVALLAGSTAVKFFGPTTAQAALFMPFPSAIKLPANTELCALGVATNTTNIQVSGYTAP